MSASGPAARRPRVAELGVQDWFRLVFAALGVLAVLAGVLVAWLTVQTRGTSNELTNSILPAQAQAYRLQGALVDQETGVRGYGLTGDVRFLQPYTVGLATEKAAAAQLRAAGRREEGADGGSGPDRAGRPGLAGRIRRCRPSAGPAAAR